MIINKNDKSLIDRYKSVYIKCKEQIENASYVLRSSASRHDWGIFLSRIGFCINFAGWTHPHSHASLAQHAPAYTHLSSVYTYGTGILRASYESDYNCIENIDDQHTTNNSAECKVLRSMVEMGISPDLLKSKSHISPWSRSTRH